MEREVTLSESELLALQFQLSTEALPSKEQRLREASVHEIKLIEHFLRTHRPLLSQARREIIEQKLELEKEAKRQALSRTKRHDFFLRYDYNPLSEKENTRPNKSLGKPQLKESLSARKLGPRAKEQRLSQISLIDAVGNIKSDGLGRSDGRTLKSSATTERLSSQTNKPRPLHHGRSGKREGSEAGRVEEELSFEQIVALPDKNYYVEHQGPINLFEFMRGNTRSLLSKDILAKFHFGFSSNVDKLQRCKILIFRELSQLGRRLVAKGDIARSVRLDVLSSAELSISLKDIRFCDLISVSSGRLDPPLVYSILYEGNAQKDASPGSSFVDSEAVDYRPDQRQKRTDYDCQLSLKQERDQYLLLENSPFEDACARRYHKFYEEAKDKVERVRSIKSNTINDARLHQTFRELINQDVLRLAKTDRNPLAEPNRLIRENKNCKNRQERLKIRELLKTIDLTNYYHQKLAPATSRSTKKR